jgi:hypothetical protein
VAGDVWLHVVGEGAKAGKVVLPGSVRGALDQYLVQRCLPVAPSKWSPSTPLLAKLDGEAGISATRLWALMKRFFETAAGVVEDGSPAPAGPQPWNGQSLSEHRFHRRWPEPPVATPRLLRQLAGAGEAIRRGGARMAASSALKLDMGLIKLPGRGAMGASQQEVLRYSPHVEPAGHVGIVRVAVSDRGDAVQLGHRGTLVRASLRPPGDHEHPILLRSI